VSLNVGVPRGSVLGPLLFAVYCSPVGDIIAKHSVQYHQYTDDTQLHVAMRADNTSAGVVSAYCVHLRRQTVVQVHAERSALIVGTSSQLKQVLQAVPSVTVAGVNLPVSESAWRHLGPATDIREAIYDGW